jgi:hypothetical protein
MLEQYDIHVKEKNNFKFHLTPYAKINTDLKVKFKTIKHSEEIFHVTLS